MKKNNLKLELYKLGELPGDWAPEADKADWDKAAAELETSDKEILEKYKPADMAAMIAKKAAQADKTNTTVIDSEKSERIIPFSRKFNTRYLIPAAAAAALILAVLLPMTMRNRDESPLELTRVKGVEVPQLKVYRQSGNDSEVLNSDSMASNFDLLQLTYRVSGPTFGMIISVDGRGVVTKHFPEDGDQSPRLTTGGEQYLPFAYELDDAPLFETFYLITSDRPFSTEEVMDLTASAAREREAILDIPLLYRKNEKGFSGKFEQYAVPIRKDGENE
ncbi:MULTISPECIES: hypothetical protein [unclassified Oceanispirochaeta]|uniref:hypothetical protein n=1 Tax=unclassified Oceanispirochaeta TaxID=2635722 RepID=UPI000E095DAD|nr:MULTISPECIES: hypothetical protein [unclassified Oceanispirochaeta]MBF9018862.1 hypothetical protein [Oceanispirochaeta sp. M2]NPD75350.1 hypothetical protein [Oceanispirochaeta sp. M1]RDG28800.1 hypothetical protein DV872_24965 [Oceanispirochaeta sp. M1]